MQPVIVNDAGFHPTTLAVTPGTTIDFRTNESGVRVLRGTGSVRFERRLTRATRTLPVVAERIGAIELSVRESADARGLVVCVDSPFLTVAERDGSFRIFGLPPGRRDVRFRLSDGTVFERRVDLVAGRELAVDWRDAE